jgi:hypothetical protein
MERQNVRGHVKIELDGRTVFEDHNLITNAGLSHIAGLLNGSQTTPFSYIALGIGVGPADVADLALESEKTDDGAERVLAQTLDRTTVTVTDDTARIVATFDITDNFDLSEIGLFSALVGGVLGAHRVFSPVAVLADQTVVVTWTLTITAVPEAP